MLSSLNNYPLTICSTITHTYTSLTSPPSPHRSVRYTAILSSNTSVATAAVWRPSSASGEHTFV